jgi:hypothetical protein
MSSYTIGSTKLWLPSRKSVASQRGGLSIVLAGHCRFSSFKGGNFRYFLEGSLSLGMVSRAFQKTQLQNYLHWHCEMRGWRTIWVRLFSVVLFTSRRLWQANIKGLAVYSIGVFIIICALWLCSGWVIGSPVTVNFCRWRGCVCGAGSNTLLLFSVLFWPQ